jgi:hypothetical protein
MSKNSKTLKTQTLTQLMLILEIDFEKKHNCSKDLTLNRPQTKDRSQSQGGSSEENQGLQLIV